MQTSPPQKGQRFRGGARSEQDLPRGLQKNPRVLESLLKKLKSPPVILRDLRPPGVPPYTLLNEALLCSNSYLFKKEHCD